MIFPVGDTNIKGGAKPFVTYTFIGLNILVFLYSISLGDGLLEFYHNYATIPRNIMNGSGFMTLLTNTFLHGGLLHILGNMLFLWIFSDNVEAVMGNLGFIAFYLAGGIFASLAHVLTNQESIIPSLGASGALSAVMGAYLVFFPKSKVKVLVIYLFRNVHISALYFLGIWFALQLFSSFSDMGRSDDEGGTAWMAHVGGFIFGVIIALVLKKYKIVQPEKYYLKA